MVYAIGFITVETPVPGLLRRRPPAPTLRRLAEMSGGGYFEVTSPRDLAFTFERVADELHHQYAIGFTPEKLDNKMHDLQLERFYEPETIAGQLNMQDGPIKTFTLRGIKDSPPYHHDGRLLTLEDTVEFFNLVLQLKLTPDEKSNLVAFMRTL